MRLGADGQFRHDGDVFQRFIAQCGMFLNGREFLICQFARFIQNLRGNTDLADVVQQSDLVIFLAGFLVIPEFFCQHFGKICHSLGMTFGIFILHINDSGKGFRDAFDQCHGFLLLLFQLKGFLANIKAHDGRQQKKRCQADEHIEPDFLIEGFLLDNLNRDNLASASHVVPELHDVMVGAAAQVGIIHGDEVTAVRGLNGVIKAVQMKTDLRVIQGIIEYIAGNRQLPGILRDGKGTVCIRIDGCAVRLQIGNDHFQVVDIVKGLFDIDFGDPCTAGDVQISLAVQFAVTVCCCNAGEAVVRAIIDRGNLFVGQKGGCRNDIDPVA